MKSFPSNCSSETSSNARWNTRLLSSQWIKIISFDMNLRALKLFCEINWLTFDYMLLTNKFILYHVLNIQFCLIFTLPSQIWAFIWGLPDFLGIGFKRLASASISFYLYLCAKNLVLSCPSLLIIHIAYVAGRAGAEVFRFKLKVKWWCWSVIFQIKTAGKTGNNQSYVLELQEWFKCWITGLGTKSKMNSNDKQMAV